MTILARRALWFAGVPAAALAGGYLGFFPVFTMGLVFPLLPVYFLAVLSGSMFATLLAAWVSNAADAWNPERGRCRIPPVLGTSALALVVGFVAGRLTVSLLMPLASSGRLWLPFVGWGVCGMVFTAVTSVAVWRLREPRTEGESPGLAGTVAVVSSLSWMLYLSLENGTAYQLGLSSAGSGPLLSEEAIFWVSLAMAAAGGALAAWHATAGRRNPERRNPETGTRGGATGRWLLGGGGLGADAGLTLLLCGLAPALVVGSFFVLCAFVYCGA